MNIISFNGYVPNHENITEYTVNLSDLDGEGAGRSETGYMNRDRIRAGLYKIQLGTTNLKDKDVTDILAAISPESVPTSFYFGRQVNANMYSGDRNLSLKSIDSDGTCYWDVSFNLVEN